MKRIVISALMHGRHAVTDECLRRNELAGIAATVMAYTTEADRKFLHDSNRVALMVFAENTILGKAQASLELSTLTKPDAVMLMGNDDYINAATLRLIDLLLDEHDYIAFSNILFRSGDKFTLWPGYDNYRKGEPAGAGKVLRTDLLDALDWDLFRGSRDVGADRHVHNRVMSKAKSPVFIGVEQGAYLVDIKDNESTTALRRFFNLKPIDIDREALEL